MKKTGKPAPQRQEHVSNRSGECLLDRLFAWLDTSLVQQAGGELARECYGAVCEMTYEKVRSMSREEVRNYVRALAPDFLVAEVDLVLQRRRVRESLRERVLAEAADQLVELVLKDISRTKSRRAMGRAA